MSVNWNSQHYPYSQKESFILGPGILPLYKSLKEYSQNPRIGREWSCAYLVVVTGAGSREERNCMTTHSWRSRQQFEVTNQLSTYMYEGV